MWLFLEYRDIFVDVLKSIQWENRQGKLESTTYLTTEIWHFLQTFVIFKLFLPLDWSSICFEDGSLLLMHAPFQQPWNAAVLKGSRPRTSDTAIWVSLIVAGPYVLALFSQELAIILVSHCVAQQLDSDNSVDLPRGPAVVAYVCIAAWIFDSLNCWCIKGYINDSIQTTIE